MNGRPPIYSDETIKFEAVMYLSGMPYAAISKATGIPKSTVANHLKYRLEHIDINLHKQVQVRASLYAKPARSIKMKKEVINL